MYDTEANASFLSVRSDGRIDTFIGLNHAVDNDHALEVEFSLPNRQYGFERASA